MSARTRNLISRVTALLVGVAMLYGAYRMLPTVWKVEEQVREIEVHSGIGDPYFRERDYDRNHTRDRKNPANLMWWPFLGLVLLGAPCTIYGLLGASAFAGWKVRERY
ncbi:MAG: hypothetical protein QM770_22620 [Tepidisphaeraceae bacterium]